MTKMDKEQAYLAMFSFLEDYFSVSRLSLADIEWTGRPRFPEESGAIATLVEPVDY